MEFVIKEKYDIRDFEALTARLRAPDGCPWDRVQTHESIRQNVIEEAYELAGAIDSKDRENLLEELGDLLMQVLLHSRMEEEEGHFNLDDVCDTACKKLVFRHPHVFGEINAENVDSALNTWDSAKRKEKGQETIKMSMEGVTEAMPALLRARKVQKRAAAGGYELPSASEAAENAKEHAASLMEALKDNDREAGKKALKKLFMNAVAVSKALDIEPEEILAEECGELINTVGAFEEKLISRGLCSEEADAGEKQELMRSFMGI
ncbi:MAG: nucleoside triphosphate pyrophosphohydrolase [Oscillospiraceae bacterium]|nr:nucleoside triphosphate pyrophosphohydrolase [Oscillospiraceae bacterium]